MWTCANCGSTVEAAFDVCWSCGTSRDGVADPSFVRADDAGPIDDPDVDALGVKHSPATATDSGAMVEAYRALDLMEAQFLVDQLTQAGISATADSQDMHVSLGGMTSDPRVYVHESDHAAARAWLADYDRNKNVTTD